MEISFYVYIKEKFSIFVGFGGVFLYYTKIPFSNQYIN